MIVDDGVADTETAHIADKAIEAAGAGGAPATGSGPPLDALASVRFGSPRTTTTSRLPEGHFGTQGERL